ncbi:hypothetical protein ACHAWO_012788 [Cyclotella atomus]|jgi:hypothetical protein|uniref:Uncharacterized protein n=1 Tax=Cyclotella atomus TaxID=382360 RepID=A0ABD3NNT7_9STRA
MVISFSIQAPTFAEADRDREEEHVEVVPTFVEEIEDVQVALTGTSTQELAELKAVDSFMYYSIPQVRKAEMLYKDVDESILESEGSVQVAKRQKRLSVECHHTQLLDDQFTGSNTEVVDLDDNFDFYSYLARLNRQNPMLSTSTSQEVHASNGSVHDLEHYDQEIHSSGSN